MSGNDDDNTLTGGFGSSGENEQTLTGGFSPDPGNEQTLTKDLTPAGDNARTLTGGFKGKTRKTLTGGFKGGSARKTLDGHETQETGNYLSSTLSKEPKAGITDWETGDKIDNRYEVLGIIGRGGMGAVYRVRHLEWDIEMAVKMPLGRTAGNEEARARFIRESQTWVDLGLHPNIVQCWYVRELGGIPRLFMDYIKGGSLKEWIRGGKVKACDWGKIIDLIIQAADGLGYAHERGVIHRDVKPANMMMTPEGRLCVTDFGLVKIKGMEDIGENFDIPVSGQAGLTMTGSIMGTPEYGAPEQWTGSKNVDFRTDIYALGIVLYEICCGKRPFDDRKDKDPPLVIVGRHRFTPPPNPLKFNNRIPAPLVNVIMQCLAKSREERPGSMPELRKELAGIYKQVTGIPYKRPIPRAADLRADSLNNKAVSLWDLGKKKESLKILEKALGYDPLHLEACKNKSILDWKKAKITDQAFIERLHEIEGVQNRRADYWKILGEVHLCRGAVKKARKALENARELDPADKKTAWLLD